MILRAPLRARHAAAGRHPETLRELGRPGCGACRRAAWSEERWLSAFVYEHYRDPVVVGRLVAARGLCPRHTRALLEYGPARWVVPSAYAPVLAAAVADTHAQRRAATPPCPLCSSVRLIETATVEAAVESLDDPAVEHAYRSGSGFCGPHVRLALPRARPRTARVLLETLEERLRAPTRMGGALETLAGADPDAPRRARWRALRERERPPDARRARATTLAELRDLLRLDACPLCVAAAETAARYQAWAGETRARSAAELSWDGIWLCPGHLHDLCAHDPDTGSWMVGRERERLERAQRMALERVRALPAAGLPDRVRAARAALRDDDRHDTAGAGARMRAAARLLVLGGRGAPLRRALGPLARAPVCAVCREAERAAERLGWLLVAALEDRPTAAVYDDSHGLCLRHAMGLPPGDTRARVMRVLRARLRVTEWELDDAAWKASWPARYAAHGAQAGAWLRAPGYLDGMALLGAPADHPRAEATGDEPSPLAGPGRGEPRNRPPERGETMTEHDSTKRESRGDRAATRVHVETSAGGVVYRQAANGTRVLLIRDPYGQWGLPKGHIEASEGAEEAAVREVAEETGLTDVRILSRLPTADWYFQKRGRTIHKICHYFLMESPSGEPRPLLEERITECIWLPIDEAERIIGYDNARRIIRAARDRLSSRFAAD